MDFVFSQVNVRRPISPAARREANLIATRRMTHLPETCSVLSPFLMRPDPHPLDFDWRFDAPSIESLVRRIPKGRALLLGCPSVAEPLANAGHEVTLIDWQPMPSLSRGIEHIRADLQSNELIGPGGHFDTVILDSPWYTDYLRTWLEQAHYSIRPGGSIMFSLWPPQTRPSASSEASQILEYATSLGSTQLESNALRYVTPTFELEAASASGNTLGDGWRRGNLATVNVLNARRDRHSGGGRDDPSASIWRRYVFDRRQIALRVPKGPPQGQPKLVSIVDGNVLADVSRRLPIRSKVDVWTSDNVVFSVIAPLYFDTVLTQLASGHLQDLSEMEMKAYRLLRANRVLEPGPFSKTHVWQHSG
jgi:hypothetical protein